MTMTVVILTAFILDVIFGDPHYRYHPVCMIGRMVSKGEKTVRKLFSKTPKGEYASGMVLSVVVVFVSFFIPAWILGVLKDINIYLSLAVQILFCYQILAAKSLKKESMKIYNALMEDDLEKARENLSYLVGRDTENLSREAIIKAAIETVAENTSDGVVAPIFFMALGGAPLAFAYKAVNTLDSMIGYKNDRYLYFGRFAAKLDDVCNWFPARVSGILMVFSAFLIGFNGKNALKIFRRDRRKHSSPNSAQTESACAGALNIQLAGDAYYFGKLYKKPTMGDKNRDVIAKDIKHANRLMYTTSVLAAICAVFAHLASYLAA